VHSRTDLPDSPLKNLKHIDKTNPSLLLISQ